VRSSATLLRPVAPVQLYEMTSQPPSVLEATSHAADQLGSTLSEPHPQVWRGLALGLGLAVVAWILLAAVGLTLYSLF
jgi:hypothetical protein